MSRGWIFGGVLVGFLVVIGCDRRTVEVKRAGSGDIRHYEDQERGRERGRFVRVSSDGAVTITAADKAEADGIFDDRCTACHGADGDGKGPAAATMKPGPKDFRNPEWQKSVTDEKITKAIVSGGQSVGPGSKAK